MGSHNTQRFSKAFSSSQSSKCQTSAKSRNTRPREKLAEMKAFEGQCNHCSGVVKMPRMSSAPYALEPESCYCIFCLQGYSMDIPNMAAWEAAQWEQKTAGIK